MTSRQKLTGRGRTLLTLELKANNLSRQQMCASSELQVEGVETEYAHRLKLLVMPEEPARKFVSEKCEVLDGR